MYENTHLIQGWYLVHAMQKIQISLKVQVPNQLHSLNLYIFVVALNAGYIKPKGSAIK